jgi:tRNA threonylcarbamoyladenosine dehydratase
MNEDVSFTAMTPAPAVFSPDFERRFGGLRRLYGQTGAQRIFEAHIVIVGIGGVGSWTAEALARSGVKRLSLIDLDHITESNINRQIHALDVNLGQAKIQAMRERIHAYHPQCMVDTIDDFVTAHNVPDLLAQLHTSPHAIIDACDQVQAKTALAAWALEHQLIHVCIGAAGGKTQAHAIEVADLFHVTHDPLLAQVRYRLRKHHHAPKDTQMGVTCVFTRENVKRPLDVSCESDLTSMTHVDANLNCHGYGSVVTVTASLGLAAAGHVLNVIAAEQKLKKRPKINQTLTKL